MIEATIEVQDTALRTIQALLRRLLQQGAVDALLVPVTLPAGNTAPMLVTDPDTLDRANPLTPLLPINAARAAAHLTATPHPHKLGLVLRPCEIRALVELVKFQQAHLDNTLLIGLDCLGTFQLTDWQAATNPPQLTDHLLAGAATAQWPPLDGIELRTACQMCEHPLPQGDHLALSLGLIGVEPGTLFLQARPDLAEILDLTASNPPPRRAEVTHNLLHARTEARDAALADFRRRVHSLDGLLAEFSTCIRCHNCMINCPICYCRECIFRTPTFEHESQLFFQWAERKGSVRMLPDTLLFHLTRLNHMVTSCVGCGICTDVCPADIPVATVFRAVGQDAQAIFDYHPGRSLDEAAPVQEFREDELTTLGERPH